MTWTAEQIAAGHTERFCRECGFEFGEFVEPDCRGCHLCFGCAWPDCPVCGDEDGVRLNAAEGKVKPEGFGSEPWKP